MRTAAVITAVVTVIMVAAVMGAAMGAPTAQTGSGFGPSAFASADIPPDYLVLYQTTGGQQGLDWTILAGIGKVETDHGRSSAPGVHSGLNSFGCCAGPMQFDLRTWEIYGAGGDIYNPADAIPAAGRYLHASGAPNDYHRAILTYNHSEKYYRDVIGWAERYRGDPGGLGGSGHTLPLDPEAAWLGPVPGTSVQCDRRIVPDMVWIIATYKVTPTSCYAPTGHQANGEHPLGLATDLVPGPGGSWATVSQLAHDLGWRDACAGTGCASQSFIRPFRFIGWNGYPGHGDPAHAGGNAHLHLSWNHGPGVPAETVDTLR